MIYNAIGNSRELMPVQGLHFGYGNELDNINLQNS